VGMYISPKAMESIPERVCHAFIIRGAVPPQTCLNPAPDVG
jgi:hypothetical protein